MNTLSFRWQGGGKVIIDFPNKHVLKLYEDNFQVERRKQGRNWVIKMIVSIKLLICIACYERKH